MKIQIRAGSLRIRGTPQALHAGTLFNGELQPLLCAETEYLRAKDCSENLRGKTGGARKKTNSLSKTHGIAGSLRLDLCMSLFDFFIFFLIISLFVFMLLSLRNTRICEETAVPKRCEAHEG